MNPRYKTVRDIPEEYVLLQGDAASEVTGMDHGCAFVIVNEGEILSLYVTDSSVPWLDASVHDVIYTM